ncbi:MAG: MmcQ/YjbR family DNA-binding protein [Clostridiaceae bacterium]
MRDWISDACLQMRAVEDEFKPSWNATVYRVGGKIFVMLGEYKDGRPLLTVKLEPAFSEILRAQYPGDIIPGYYTDKTHWSSLFLDSDVPDDVARAMLLNGYETIFSSLTRKAQAEILAHTLE